MVAKLRISDGVTTVTLSETDAYLTNWDPAYVDAGMDQVGESIEVTFFGGNAALEANLEELNLLLQQARQYGEGMGVNPVYLRVSRDGTEDLQSLILDGALDVGENWLKFERANGERAVVLTILRVGWWEKAEALIEANNGNTYLNDDFIYNVNDGEAGAGAGDTRKAWVASASVIDGDMDSPLISILTQLSAHSASRIWIANQVLEDAAFTPVLEMEGCAEGSQVPAAKDATLYSAGYARSLTLTTSMAKIASRAIPDLDHFMCNYFNVLATFGAGSVGTDVVLQVKLTGPSGTPVLYEGPYVYCTTSLTQWLDSIKLPPLKFSSYTVGTNIEIHIFGKRTTTATALVIDQLWFLPTYGFREYSFLNAGTLAQNFSILDNPYVKTVLRRPSDGSSMYFDVRTVGEPIMLCPGKTNYLWVIRDYGATARPSAYMRFEGVHSWLMHRPRWRNI